MRLSTVAVLKILKEIRLSREAAFSVHFVRGCYFWAMVSGDIEDPDVLWRYRLHISIRLANFEACVDHAPHQPPYEWMQN